MGIDKEVRIDESVLVVPGTFNLEDEEFTSGVVTNHRQELQEYVNRAREHVTEIIGAVGKWINEKYENETQREELKTELTGVFDGLNQTYSKDDRYLKGKENRKKPEDYAKEPAELLSKMYVFESFNEDGTGKENREQFFITTGEKLKESYFDKGKMGDLKKASEVVDALNNLLTGYNKIEKHLKDFDAAEANGKEDKFEHLKMELQSLDARVSVGSPFWKKANILPVSSVFNCPSVNLPDQYWEQVKKATLEDGQNELGVAIKNLSKMATDAEITSSGMEVKEDSPDYINALHRQGVISAYFLKNTSEYKKDAPDLLNREYLGGDYDKCVQDYHRFFDPLSIFEQVAKDPQHPKAADLHKKLKELGEEFFNEGNTLASFQHFENGLEKILSDTDYRELVSTPEVADALNRIVFFKALVELELLSKTAVKQKMNGVGNPADDLLQELKTANDLYFSKKERTPDDRNKLIAACEKAMTKAKKSELMSNDRYPIGENVINKMESALRRFQEAVGEKPDWPNFLMEKGEEVSKWKSLDASSMALDRFKLLNTEANDIFQVQQAQRIQDNIVADYQLLDNPIEGLQSLQKSTTDNKLVSELQTACKQLTTARTEFFNQKNSQASLNKLSKSLEDNTKNLRKSKNPSIQKELAKLDLTKRIFELDVKAQEFREKSRFYLDKSNSLDNKRSDEKAKLKKKSEEYRQAYIEADRLCGALRHATVNFYQQPENIKKFYDCKRICDEALQDNKLPHLKMHRGAKQILINIAKAVFTLGLLPFFHKIRGKSFFPTVDTDTISKVKAFKKAYSKLQPKVFFQYDFDGTSKEKGLPGPVKEESDVQCCRDWNSRLNDYYINGKSLKELAEKDGRIKVVEGKAEGVAFEEGEKNIEGFFKKHLLANVKNETEKDKLAKLCIKHLHQAGIPHAMGYLIQKYNNQSTLTLLGLKTRVDFTPTETGFTVRERNWYQKTFECDGITGEVDGPDAYFVKTDTKTDFGLKGVCLQDERVDYANAELKEKFEASAEKLNPSDSPAAGLGHSP